MRALAIILNISLIGTVILLMSAEPGIPKGKDLALAILFLLAPITSLLSFYLQRGEGWLSLYFKRKALEEKKKIERINSEKIP